MKKAGYILCMLSVAVSVLSCVENEIPAGGGLANVPYYMSVNKDLFEFDASGEGAETLSISSKNVSWRITGVPDWISLSAVSGIGDANIKVKPIANKQVDEARVALMKVESTIENYEYSRDVTVSQAAAAVCLEIDKGSISLMPQAASAMVTVKSNIEWEAVCDALWVTLSKSDSGTLLIGASENITGKSRTATVSLRRAGTTAALAAISITQSEGGVTGSADEVKFGIDGGAKRVDIKADVAWSAVSSSPSWLAVTPESGKGGDVRLMITALANNSSNTRSGFVYVKIGTVEKLAIPVSQECINIDVNGSLHDFPADGNEVQKLNITANRDWKVLSLPEWLTVEPAEGNKGATVELSMKACENISLNSRSATLRIGIENLDVYKDIPVTQSGIEPGLDGTVLEFLWEGSQKEIDVAVPHSWNAMVSGDWFSLSQYSGSGGERVIVTAQTNDTEDARTGTVSIVSEDKLLKLSVVQQGQYLKISSTAGELPAMGGSVNLNVSTTVGAKDSIEYEGTVDGWLAAECDGDGSYTLTAAYNPSVNPRTACFVVKPELSTTNSNCTQGVRFMATQYGRALMTSTDKIEIFPNGGTSETCIITADGVYDISKPDSDNWYIIQHNEDASTFSIVVSENMTGEDRTSQITLSLGELPEGEEKTVTVNVLQLAENANISVGGYGDDKDWDTQTGTANGYEWVDLGLPSRTLWATCNVGASKPEEYGNYYAWGEITVKESYTIENSVIQGKNIGDISGNAEYDAACAEWGNGWRMPAYDEFKELITYCKWGWTNWNGVMGIVFTGKNGNSIFLPAAGNQSGTEVCDKGSQGYYWSSTPNGDCTNAYVLPVRNSYPSASMIVSYMGCSVRPVCDLK